jgi:hypothetical protein
MKLFTADGDRNTNAHFAWSGFNTTFAGYTMGYKGAADCLVDSVIRSRNPSKLDTYIFPILFLYRQYLELEMKGIYLKYSHENRLKKIKEIKDCSHNLMRIWNRIVPIITEYASEGDIEAVGIVEKYIQQFHNFDTTSISFRYPIDNKLDLIFDGEKRISYTNLKQRMDELESFFNGVTGYLIEVQDYKNDMLSYF